LLLLGECSMHEEYVTKAHEANEGRDLIIRLVLIDTDLEDLHGVDVCVVTHFHGLTMLDIINVIINTFGLSHPL
jgi:hypothetical protein